MPSSTTESLIHSDARGLPRMDTNYLTEQGVIDTGRLYEPPFTDISSAGPEAVLGNDGTDQVVAILARINQRAAA